MPISSTFAASLVFENPGRRELATARMSTSSSTPARRSACWKESTVALWYPTVVRDFRRVIGVSSVAPADVEQRRVRPGGADERESVGEGREAAAEPHEHVCPVARPHVFERSFRRSELEAIRGATPRTRKLAMGHDRPHHRIRHGKSDQKAMMVGEIEAQAARGRVHADVFSARDTARERAEAPEAMQSATELEARRA